MKILLISCSPHKEGNSYLALKEAEAGINYKILTSDAPFTEIEWLHLSDYFFSDGTEKEYLSDLISKVQSADGLIFGTPVYFGAWSSLAQRFYEYLKDNKVDLFKKVIGFVVVGAKRNGGQETTITFAGWDLMGLGACMVNDGYPVSQFGGTCVGGLVGDVSNDKEGLQMAFNTGKRVVETVMILNAGYMSGATREFVWPPPYKKMNRCKGCAECPSKELYNRNEDYKCRYSDDEMPEIHKKLMDSNLISPTTYDLRFFERTRYLRRDNYRLTYHVVWIPEPKWIPLFIKQNCILTRERSHQYAWLVSTGKEKLTLEKQIYEPIGYENIYLK
jgi:multimeric flavodoxin WrbA